MDQEVEIPRRGPGRPPINRTEVRPESRPEIRTEARRERKRKGNMANDKFAIPVEQIPLGSSYEWKRKTVYGAGDPSYDVMMREQGWLPVDVSRHPDFMPPGWKGAIERDGLILMERPIELTQEARDEEQSNARMMVRAKEEQLGLADPGHFERRNGRDAMTRITRSYEPTEIPE